MRTDLDHLQETKKRELARVVENLFAEFEAAIARRSNREMADSRHT